MNEIVIVSVTFVALSFIIAQIRFIRRLIRLKNRNVKLGSAIVLSLSELICTLFECGACCCQTFGDNPTSYRHSSDTGKKVDYIDVRAQKRLSEIKEPNKEIDIQTKNELKVTVNELLMNTKKLSLQWISTISMIPIENVIDILSDDLSFLIEGDYVLKSWEVPKRDIIELEEIKAKIAKGICPECSSTIKPGVKYCPACGFELY